MRAQRSNPALNASGPWIASSLSLLAMTSLSIPRCDLHPGCCARVRKFCLRRTGGVSFASPSNKGGGAPNGAPAVPASQRDAGAVICDRSPFGAPPRLCAEVRHPNSAWAALPGIAGCKRGSPLRRQCSRHPAVRSRAGRVDAQAACKLRATNSAYRNRSRSVSRVTG